MRAVYGLSAAALAVALGVAAPPARADTPVLIEGADENTRRAILDVLPDRDRPTTLFEAERIAEEAAARARIWLRSEGYYAAVVTPQASEEPAIARLIIEPGARFRFAPAQLRYSDAAPDETTDRAVRRALDAVTDGAPARAAIVLQAESDALTALQQAGYAVAAAGERRVVVDHATQTVTAEFAIAAGSRVVLGRVRAEPTDVFRPSFVSRLQNWEDGAAYTPQALARLRRDVSATGAVSRVATSLAPPGETGASDVLLEVTPARRNAYEVGVGYSTTEGLGLQAEWTRRNFTGRADALTLSTTLAEMQQALEAQWRRPHAAGLGHALTIGTALDREELDAYTRTGVSAFASVDASTRLRVGQSYGVTLSANEFDDLSGAITRAVVLSGFASQRYDTTEFSLDPRDGTITEFRIEPSYSTGDESLAFVRGTAEARAYESFGREDALTLAARIRAGWMEAIAGDKNDAPPDRRFYAGGGGSVRGYQYNSVYPRERDALGLTPGGQGLLEGSIEARWRFGERWGAAAFIDGGTAFDEWSAAGDLSWGVGVGARYDLGFAPLRIDLAIPLDRDESEDDFALYISLGQAF
jgi:translocation and assembly module TamA